MGQHSDHFEQNSSIFLEWFTNANGTQLNPNLVLADFRDSGAGRGVSKYLSPAIRKALLKLPHPSR